VYENSIAAPLAEALADEARTRSDLSGCLHRSSPTGESGSQAGADDPKKRPRR
jgi:hypothetical protein